MLFRSVRFYKPDDGKGGDGGTGNDPGTQDPKPGEGSNNGNPLADGSPKGGPSFASEADFQKKVDEILKDRLERERKKAEEAAKKAADEAVAEAAKKNGEWQKVAEQREKEIAEAREKLQELDKAQEQINRYSETLNKHLETQRAGLPEAITKLLDKLDPVDQLEWLAANKEAIGKTKLDGPPPSPSPDGGANGKQLEEAKEEFARRVRNWF
ncbi:MAG: hypothetical protein QMD04_08725 [Anaerolineales bacterium]|nr:hypothetical protein [Anaerolineales bacterium]